MPQPITPNFDKASENTKWPVGAYQAVAEWVADYLELGADKRPAFTGAMVEGLRERNAQHDSGHGTPRKSLQMDTGLQFADSKSQPGYGIDSVLSHALAAAGIPGGRRDEAVMVLSGKEKSFSGQQVPPILIFEDGQVFVPDVSVPYPVQLKHAAQPDRPLVDAENIDFPASAPFFMNERGLLAVDLEPGTEIKIAGDSRGLYSGRIAKEGDVLILDENDVQGQDFGSVTKKQVLDAADGILHTCCRNRSREDKSEPLGRKTVYADSVSTYKLESESGGVRRYSGYSTPFQALRVQKPCAVKTFNSYIAHVKPGDYLVKSAKKPGRVEVIKKDWLESGVCRWLSSTKEGQILDKAPFKPEQGRVPGFGGNVPG